VPIRAIRGSLFEIVPSRRPPCIQHCTSEPYRFFGRRAELALLDAALAGGHESVIALVGPGGQGKTAIVQHWLETLSAREGQGPDGLFLWSFYRGKDADWCLRALYGYAAGLGTAPDVSASYCVDHLLPILRRERWAVLLDGAEVAQHDSGSWFGRFVHPEMGRLVEELASEPMPGVVVLTTRFPLPTLANRHHARIVSLSGLDADSARALLDSLGVRGKTEELDAVAEAGGYHAKAVELLGTYLRRYHAGEARRHAELPEVERTAGASDEEHRVARVLAAYHRALPAEAQDVLALATAFRDPPTEARLLDYLTSEPVRTLLQETWRRPYVPFVQRPRSWLAGLIQELIDLRLLERVGRAGPNAAETVIDAHPLVRRGFEHVLGQTGSPGEGQREGARVRAGFLRGRPDRMRPRTLEEAREEVELFHAYCDAGLWTEADSTLVALDNPKHRFLAPVLERDLLLRFFPAGDWRQPPLWPGFGRYRSLAICFELLGQFEDALAAYREADAPLRGDALLALGRLGPLLDQPQAPHPWQTLWQAYRGHALCLAGRTDEAVALARSLVPVDVYEWCHVFECLLRAGRLDALDLRSLLFRPPHTAEHRWAELARRRMRLDYLRVREGAPAGLGDEYEELLEAYDRGGLPWERCLTRLGHACWLLARGEGERCRKVLEITLDLTWQHGMPLLAADAWALLGEAASRRGNVSEAENARDQLARLRGSTGWPARPRP
jgi:tetratricopeptide (TPR) repeat protein